MASLSPCLSPSSLIEDIHNHRQIFWKDSNCLAQLCRQSTTFCKKSKFRTRLNCVSKLASNDKAEARLQTYAKRGRGRKKDPKLDMYSLEPPDVFVPQAMDWIHKDAHTLAETLCNHYGNDYLACTKVAEEAKEYWKANLGHDERLRYILQRSIKASVERTKGIVPAWEPLVSIVDEVEEEVEEIRQALAAMAKEEEEEREEGEEGEEREEREERRKRLDVTDAIDVTGSTNVIEHERDRK